MQNERKIAKIKEDDDYFEEFIEEGLYSSLQTGKLRIRNLSIIMTGILSGNKGKQTSAQKTKLKQQFTNTKRIEFGKF